MTSVSFNLININTTKQIINDMKTMILDNNNDIISRLKKLRCSRKAFILLNQYAIEMLEMFCSQLRSRDDLYNFIIMHPKWIPDITLDGIIANDHYIFNAIINDEMIERFVKHMSTKQDLLYLIIDKLLLKKQKNNVNEIHIKDVGKIENNTKQKSLLFFGQTKDFLMSNHYRRFAYDDIMIKFLMWIIDGNIRKCLNNIIIILMSNNRIKTVTVGIVKNAILICNIKPKKNK